MYVQQVQCVVLYSAHMFNQDEGFVDSNLTLCDLQISEEEEEEKACALECEASVCLDVTRGSAGDLHFSISGDNSGTWLRRIWLTEPGLGCSLEDMCGGKKKKKKKEAHVQKDLFSAGCFTRGHRL